MDGFEDLSEWNKIESDGAKVKISSAKGFIGKGIKIDFEFQGAGFCGIARRLKLDLPYNYKFYFYLSRRDGYPKANAPLNNFEFKLTDSTAENVWWKNNRNFEFPKKWEKIIIKKRHITFAWGPKKESSLEKVERIELIISASQGGKGTVYIDELNFEPLSKSETSSNEPTIIASSSLDNNSPPNFIIDNNPSTVWRSLSQSENQSLTFDLHTSRE